MKGKYVLSAVEEALHEGKHFFLLAVDVGAQGAPAWQQKEIVAQGKGYTARYLKEKI